MVTFEEFSEDLWNLIEEAIENGVSGSVIADTIVNVIQAPRENVLEMICSVGAQLNMIHNPGMTPQEALDAFLGK